MTRSLLVSLAVVASAASFASTIRHDRNDADYQNLANQGIFASVGAVTAGGGLGSGSYIGFGNGFHWVLTAAHVSSSMAGSPTFHIGGNSYAANAVFAFSGWGLNNNDFSLLRLSSNPGVAAVPFYNGNLDQGRDTVSVGFGATGTGLTGITGAAGTKRAFTNVADVVSVNGSTNAIFTDFDNPNNPSDSWSGSSTPTNLEGNVAGGDSGGALFGNFNGEWRQIGVTSTLAWVDGSGNADYGDLSGYARIGGANPVGANFITSTTGIQGVPEPATMIALGAGLAALAARRRRNA